MRKCVEPREKVSDYTQRRVQDVNATVSLIMMVCSVCGDVYKIVSMKLEDVNLERVR